MNKLFRKLLVLVLSLTVAISLVGCNKGGDNSGSNDNGGNQTPPVVDDGSPNTSTVQPEAPSISMSNAINFIVGEVKSANVSTKNIDGEVVYTSSDPSVATASNGFITAVGAGTAIITASYGEATPVSCNVTVSYGDYLPSLGLQSNLTGSQTFAVNRTYDVLPYVSFNKIAYYDDATFEYEVSDPTVLSVENGVITTLKTGTATLTINASWRDFTAKENVAGKTQTNTLSQTFDVVVRDNVAFYDNGTLLKAKTLMTPASFQDAADYGNVHKVVPTVIVNGETKSVSAEDITVKPVGASIDGVDYVWDPANQTITVNSMRTAGSGAVVEFKYVGADNTEYLDNFVIYFERPVEVLTSGVELFSAKLGTYKVKSGDGYVEKTLESYAWGKDVELLDAFQDGNALTINNTTGAVTGLAVNQDTYIDTTVVLGTMTEIYEIPVRAAQVYMATAQDIKVALERINDPIVASGYHLLLNDVDMDGVLVDNRIKGTEAETFTLYDGNGNLVVSYPRNISFGGVFDGAGHVIYNATTVLPNRNFVYYKEYDFVNNQPVGTVYKNDPSFGFFHKIDQNAIIKDVAFVNAKGTGNTSNAYGLSAPLSFGLYGTVENCYIHIAPDSPTVRGPFANIHGSSDIRNTVIYYEMPEDYNFTLEAGKIASKDLYAWGYGSLGQNVDGVIKTPTGFSNNYVISKAPLSFNTADAKALNDDDSANDSIVYGENETKLHYNFSIFDTVHGKVEHTVQSTAGERLVEYEKTKITGKTRVISNFQRYDSYEDFAASDYAGIATYNKAYTVNNPYWVLAGNVPIWHSLIDQHADKFYATINDNATLEVDCYDTAEFDVKLYGGSVQDLVLTSSSDLIQIEGTLIKGLKVGTGATVTANFTFGGKAYTRVFDVDVANPFYYNDGSVDFDTKTSLREGTSIDLTVLIKGEVVENVTYTTTATEFLSISGNTINGIKLGRNNVVKASFTYQGTQYELEFLVTVLDPIAEDAVVTIDGVDLTEESFNVVIGESATIGIISDAGAVQSVTVADPNGLFSVNNNVITGELYGETILNVTFVIDGVSHVKEVKATTTRTTVTIDDLVVFDAYVGAILSSSIDNTGVVNAVVSYPG
ncbi:MAG: hypothetical protein J6V66_00605, partial [Clostridia bacterium]|nr:hypothetical protein [Clostridia bacterium]